jgi:hypothetical protein
MHKNTTNVLDASDEVHRNETSCKVFHEMPGAVQLLFSTKKVRMRAIGKVNKKYIPV